MSLFLRRGCRPCSGQVLSLVSLLLMLLRGSDAALMFPSPAFSLARERTVVVASTTSLAKGVSKPSSQSLLSKAKEEEEEALTPLIMLQRVQRLPLAVLKITATSFFSTAQVMVPIGCVLQIRTLFREGPKKWIVSGSKMGLDWGVISGTFAGGEVLFAVLRGKQDRWNTYLGSGLASAAMGAKDGPLGMAQGFVAGFCFVYAIDRFLPSSGEELPHMPGVAARMGQKGITAAPSAAAARGGAAAAVKRYKKF